MATTSPTKNDKRKHDHAIHQRVPTSRHASVLDDLPFYMAGIYYGFRGLVERSLLEVGMDRRIRPGMGSVFLALFEEDNCIIKSLVDRLKIANGTLTGLLQAMEKAGVIERHRCPDDGRAVRVKLTRFGRSMEKKMREGHQRAVGVLQADFSRTEINQLKYLMGRVLTSMTTDEVQWKEAPAREQRAKAGGKGKQPNGC